MNAPIVDADGHVLEPADLWLRYVDPPWRDRAIRVRRGADGRDTLEIDGRPARLTTPEMLGGLGGMGRTLEELAAAALSGRYAENVPPAAVDPAARLALLDDEGLSHAVLYPTLGLQWEAEAPDAAYALAHVRAYNRWIEEFCSGGGGRLVPVAHLSLGDPAAAAAELRRAVRAGARGAFVLPFTWSGLPHGHPDHDPVWAAAEDLGVPIAIHTGIDPPARDLHHRFDGVTWPEAVPPGVWYLQMLFPQAVQQAFSTFFQFATFDRFPRLHLVVLESGAGWLGFWMDRMDALAGGALRVTMALRERPSDYVRRQCWIAADPDEHTLPAIIAHVGADRFLWASDFPHADHDGDYMHDLHALAATLPEHARGPLLGANARALYRLSWRVLSRRAPAGADGDASGGGRLPRGEGMSIRPLLVRLGDDSPSREEIRHVRAHQYRPTPPRAARTRRASVSGLPRSRRDGQVASAARLHRQGPPDGRARRRRLPDVVHELRHRQEPFVRRHVRRAHAARANPLHRQVRRSQPAGRDAGHDHAARRSPAEPSSRSCRKGIPAAIPVEFCYLGWQESLSLLAQLVEPTIPDGA